MARRPRVRAARDRRRPSAAGARARRDRRRDRHRRPRRARSPTSQRRLQEAGTYHVIAISGGNIAILAGSAARRVPPRGPARPDARCCRRSRRCVAYGCARRRRRVGRSRDADGRRLLRRARGRSAEPAAERARARRRPASWPSTPLSVADPAFVLTFGATLAILVVVPRRAAPRGRGSVGRVGIASRPRRPTEALLFPVGALVFSRVTFAGLALNFVAIPLMARRADRRDGDRAGGAGVARGSRRAAGWLAHLGADGLVRSADLVRFAPVADLAGRAAESGDRGRLLRGDSSAGGRCWRRRASAGSAESARASRAARLACAAMAVAAALWILAEPWALLAAPRRRPPARRRSSTSARATRRSSGFRDGATLLVDAGGLSSASTFDIGDRVVAPVLRDAGVRRLDLLVAHARRPRSHRRRAGDRARVPAARGVGGDSRAARRAAARARARRRGALGVAWTQRDGRRPATVRTTSRWSCGIRRRPTGSASACGTTIRS